MTTPKNNVNPIPPDMHSITPHLICDGAADAIEFYKKAFGAVELARLARPDGKLVHAMIKIGDSPIMLNDEFPDWGCLGPKSLKSSPVTIHIYTQDVDALFEQAVKAGAEITMPLDNAFWGDRYGRVRDPFGHHWSLASHIADLSKEEIEKAAAKCCG